VYNIFRRDVRVSFFVLLAFTLVGIASFSIYALKPVPADRYGHEGGDGSYWLSMDLVETGQHSPDFLANRFVTGSAFIFSVVTIEKVVGNREVAWLLLNSLFYIGLCLCFYALATRVLQDKRVAFLSTLLLALNYATVVFGLSYGADASGWFFYVVALYCSFRYITSKQQAWLWAAAALIGVGGLFKEYALCAYVVVAGSICIVERGKWLRLAGLVAATGMIAIAPFLLANLGTWLLFHYSYLNWWAYNQTRQSIYPDSRLDEYIKVLGSLYNVAWIFGLGGLIIFWRRRKEVRHNTTLQFIILVILSSMPVLVWPPFQRVFFITAPAFAIVAGLFFKRVTRYWLLLPIFVAYALFAYLLDAYIFKMVNINPMLHFLLSGL